MDKKSKIFFIVFFLIIIIVILVSFFKYFVYNNYYIKIVANCDPAVESCFIGECYPEEDETCNENPDKRLYYYKIINKNFKNIQPCNFQTQECPELSCKPEETDCEEVFCDENELLEGESCSNLADFVEEETNRR